MNLKKALVATTITSTSVATLGLSFFIVGGYGNNINSLSEIQNSGFFGLNTAFEKENTTTYNTKEKYVNHLIEVLEIEASKIDSDEYNNLKNQISSEETKILEQEAILAPLAAAVKLAQDKFNNDRTIENKEELNLAQKALNESTANGIIADSRSIIESNNQTIARINLSKGDIARLENYSLWNTLFIMGSTLLSIGSVLAIASTSYSIYLKKQESKKSE
ncbi:MAG: hypothetical protein ACRC1F_02105 [Metamycoplasmataceae bacterium]